MTSHDPTAAYRSHVVDQCMTTLAVANSELLQVRERFRPIFNYYVNPSWPTTIARRLRLIRPVDFARFATELEQLGRKAAEIVQGAGHAFAEIRAVGQAPDVAEFAYRQITLDGAVVIGANEFVKAMLRRDPIAGRHFGVMTRMANEARTNQAAIDARIRAIGAAKRR